MWSKTFIEVFPTHTGGVLLIAVFFEISQNSEENTGARERGCQNKWAGESVKEVAWVIHVKLSSKSVG